MTDRTFSRACDVTAEGPDSFVWDVPSGWLQGRGAWGGLVVAASVNAAEAAQLRQDPSRRVRNVTAHLFGALPAGEARISVTCLRAGSAMTTWGVQITGSDGAVASQSVVITGTARATDVEEPWGTSSMPELPTWESVPVVPVVPPLGPEFGVHLEYRPTVGIPGSGASPEGRGWISAVPDPDTGFEWTAGLVLGMVDAWWPASYVAMSNLRPMATVSFSAHLLVDPATLDPAAPLGYESWVSSMEHGFTSETRRLWAPDGRLVVENHQSIVIVK